MSDDLILDNTLSEENIEKIKVSSAEIVVHGTKERPYYEIKYFDLSDNEMHIGYSSYKLDIVFEYLEKYFDIVDEKGETEQRNYRIVGDLIGRKAVYKAFSDYLNRNYIGEISSQTELSIGEIASVINSIPIAFYKEKVRQELERSSKLYSLNNRDCEFAIPQNIALEIVDRGGLNEHN